MGNEVVKDKIRKLIAHEQSARAIGNVLEANAYATHVRKLLRRHKLTKKALNQPADKAAEADLCGAWKCSCGFSLELEIRGMGLNPTFAVALLSPHRAAGHRLTRL